MHGQDRGMALRRKEAGGFDRVGERSKFDGSSAGPVSSPPRADPIQAFKGLMTLALPTPTDDRRAGPDARRSPGRRPRS